MKVILDAPSLKEGTGRELRKLHDLAQQHLRALKSMKYDPGPSVLELKLDATTTFEWQKHSQTQRKVPHYQDLLDFINLRAQASESRSQQQVKKTNTVYLLIYRTAKNNYFGNCPGIIGTDFYRACEVSGIIRTSKHCM